MSLLTLDTAARLCTFAVRYCAHLKKLQLKCRMKFRRYLDNTTITATPMKLKKHKPASYYYNTVYKSSSWNKPYCMRGQELYPIITRNQAASLIQGLYKMYKARQKVIKKIVSHYVKIFDRVGGTFYYAYNGPSLLIPKQKWKKPMALGKRGYNLYDIDVLYTIDISAIKIQNKWRSVLVGIFVLFISCAFFCMYTYLYTCVYMYVMAVIRISIF